MYVLEEKVIIRVARRINRLLLSDTHDLHFSFFLSANTVRNRDDKSIYIYIYKLKEEEFLVFSYRGIGMVTSQK